MGRGAHPRGLSAREFARRFAAPDGGRPDGARSGLRNVCFDRTLTPLGTRRGNAAFLLARLPGAVRKDECFRNLTAFQAREAFPDVQPTARVRPPVRSGSDHWTLALGQGGAEVESRFDRFDIKSQLPANLTEANRNALLADEEEFAQSLRGRPLSLRYDGGGHLTGIQGTDEMLQQVSAPFRRPLLQAFRY